MLTIEIFIFTCYIFYVRIFYWSGENLETIYWLNSQLIFFLLPSETVDSGFWILRDKLSSFGLD